VYSASQPGLLPATASIASLSFFGQNTAACVESSSDSALASFFTGTLTSYLMALDPRIACAAPGCYITSFARLLEKAGPQDAEQNIFAQIAHGMDHADYVMMRAPKPTLLLAATNDFFDIRGAWDSYRDAKRLYTKLGYPERVDLVEANEQHGFTKPLRLAMVRWMRRWPRKSTRRTRVLDCASETAGRHHHGQ
jgi:hypothetical protein